MANIGLVLSGGGARAAYQVGAMRALSELRGGQKRSAFNVLAGLSARYPELHRALWHGDELGEHIEVLVNNAVLGIDHTLDSPLRPGDQITLRGAVMETNEVRRRLALARRYRQLVGDTLRPLAHVADHAAVDDV